MGNCFGSKLDATGPSSIHHISTKSSTPVASSSFGTTSAKNEASLPGEILQSSDLKIYTFADLKAATKGFKSDSVLGIGGFGTVFKGWVDEQTLAPSKNGTGMIVAIKKLNPEGMQGFEEWQENGAVTFMRIWIIGTKCRIFLC